MQCFKKLNAKNPAWTTHQKYKYRQAVVFCLFYDLELLCNGNSVSNHQLVVQGPPGHRGHRVPQWVCLWGFTMVGEQTGQLRTSYVILFFDCKIFINFSTWFNIWEDNLIGVYRGAEFSYGRSLQYGLVQHCRKVLTWLVDLEDDLTALGLIDVSGWRFLSWDSSQVLWRQPLGTLGCLSCDVFHRLASSFSGFSGVCSM